MTQQSRLVERSGRPGGRFLLSLLHRPLWLLAIALNGAGILLELFALREVSLIVVQPLMSVGLIGLVFAARVFLGERIDRHTVLAAGALVSGVACVILAAPSSADAVRLGHPVASIVVLGALAVILTSAYISRGPRGRLARGDGGRSGRHARRHLRQSDRQIVDRASPAGALLDRGSPGSGSRRFDGLSGCKCSASGCCGEPARAARGKGKAER